MNLNHSFKHTSIYRGFSERLLGCSFSAGQRNVAHGQYVDNTAAGFKMLWTFSGSGADCDVNTLGSFQQPTPPNTLMGECGARASNVMSSGEVCGLRCAETFGLAGAIDVPGTPQTSPTYPYFRDMVVCFDGTIEVHAFTCEKIVTHAGSHYSHSNICHPNAAKLTQASGRLSDGSEASNYNTNVDCGVMLEAPAGEHVVRSHTYPITS